MEPTYPIQIVKPPAEYQRTAPGIQGVEEVQGPLVRQTPPAARLARILHHAAEELWDLCTYTDQAEMWEEARAIASRILEACPTK
ncbi:MAG: hypothetical protein WB424_11135 [Terracidiphilus sp.]